MDTIQNDDENKLIKFRPLTNKNDFKRALYIIMTGEFWFSKILNMNDAMEGISSIYD